MSSDTVPAPPVSEGIALSPRLRVRAVVESSPGRVPRGEVCWTDPDSGWRYVVTCTGTAAGWGVLTDQGVSVASGDMAHTTAGMILMQPRAAKVRHLAATQIIRHVARPA